MGLSSANIANEGVQFCIFDSRRGQHEGQELDKILFFYPSECPYSSQLSLIGLCEGMITFTRIFSPEAACEIIEAERHSHVFYEAEPDMWMIMVVEKSKLAESAWRSEALRGVLKEIYSFFVMFHGSLKTLLDKQPSGEFARSHLYYFLTDYLTDFTIGKKFQIPSFRECLKERGTVQMLTVSRDMAIEIQSLITMLGSPSGSNITYNSLVLYQDLLVSTTLSPDDTTNLFAYCILRLGPHALSSSSSVNSWSYLRKSKSASNISSSSSAVYAGSNGSQGASRNNFPGEEESRTVNVLRPLQRDKWSKGGDGFLVTDLWGTEIGTALPRTPTIWLQQTQEPTYLCVYQYKSLTIVLLIPVSSLINGEQGIALAKNQLLENVSQKIVNIEEKLSRGWGGENAYHVSGYRYLLLDGDRNISRASPPAKVTTLSKDSLLALNTLREEVDLEKKRTKLDKPEHQRDFEACVRAKNNAWVIAKISRGRELYMALEKASETLLFASEAVEKFSNRYCEGAFSLD
ncbi:vacuolar fusion protein CCZ1 homolog B [Phalaenopsis equestris]|uniref:vacuolar fusion protein CCZ1 homolog B n=1 Tax=Phalaenopsis equestris TaxID=78828 RepID=UPI0009E5900B|nr:vacuolar fusion protein CCZ1 homolog B [Phalaenopsis equestris]